jgi:hypothetical protein
MAAREIFNFLSNGFLPFASLVKWQAYFLPIPQVILPLSETAYAFNPAEAHMKMV